MNKVLLFLVDGFEEIEALTIVDVLRRANVQCDICCVKDYEVTGSHGIAVKADINIDEIDEREYNGVILPGGPGTENLKNNIRIVNLVKDFYMSGRLTAALCAAPQVLAEAGIVDGKNITSYPAVKERLKNCIYQEEVVVQDGNIITSRGPATSLPFAYAILDYLGEGEKAEELKEGMMYNFLKQNIQ
ncbi:DJ-1/PfpI family protein [Clostridium sp. 19966]|uniref:DJ-1 family glyoxalase III n=1 Tax=Clostridium sp. 19966 TaxID=2768166 RepID=UPI0028DEDB24|nr:DJ-1 family glyoxalase III [Clostridium sp. 19966]MDT8716696.1 DJ-1/PfpI family protein [Clostridium sp. 19966]